MSRQPRQKSPSYSGTLPQSQKLKPSLNQAEQAYSEVKTQKPTNQTIASDMTYFPHENLYVKRESPYLTVDNTATSATSDVYLNVAPKPEKLNKARESPYLTVEPSNKPLNKTVNTYQGQRTTKSWKLGKKVSLQQLTPNDTKNNNKILNSLKKRGLTPYIVMRSLVSSQPETRNKISQFFNGLNNKTKKKIISLSLNQISLNRDLNNKNMNNLYIQIEKSMFSNNEKARTEARNTARTQFNKLIPRVQPPAKAPVQAPVQARPLQNTNPTRTSAQSFNTFKSNKAKLLNNVTFRMMGPFSSRGIFTQKTQAEKDNYEIRKPFLEKLVAKPEVAKEFISLIYSPGFYTQTNGQLNISESAKQKLANFEQKYTDFSNISSLLKSSRTVLLRELGVPDNKIKILQEQSKANQ
jgi:hypothetical protein